MKGLGEEVQEAVAQPPTPGGRRATASTVSPRSFLSSQPSGSKRGSISSSSFRHAKVVDGGARRSTMAHSRQASSQSNARRGSLMLADVMTNLSGEQKYSMSQAMSQGNYMSSQRGNMFASTSDFSGIIHRREDDSEKIQTFKRSGNGSYTATSHKDLKGEESFIVSAIGSAYEAAKASVKSARSA